MKRLVRLGKVRTTAQTCLANWAVLPARVLLEPGIASGIREGARLRREWFARVLLNKGWP